MDDVMAPVLAGLREGDSAALLQTARAARFRMCHPFGDLEGAEAFDQSCLAPLRAALAGRSVTAHVRARHAPPWAGRSVER